MEDVETTIAGQIVDMLGCDRAKVTRDAMLIDDLGADSLDIVEFVMMIEEHFGMEIPDDEATELGKGTVGDVIDYVEKKRNAA